jgi:GntR family transcriptional regulator
MNISINVHDGVPIYRQIVNQVRYMIASGLLRSGDELSPVRALALQLKVTPNTVVKAYDELESAGLIYKRRGAGTYISDIKSPLATNEKNQIIMQRLDALFAEAHQLNISAEQLTDLFNKRKAAVMARSNKEKTHDKKCG